MASTSSAGQGRFKQSSNAGSTSTNISTLNSNTNTSSSAAGSTSSAVPSSSSTSSSTATYSLVAAAQISAPAPLPSNPDDPWNQEIIVYVKQSTGKTLTLRVRRTDTILTVKRLVGLRDGYPPSYCILRANGSIPDESEILMNLNIGNNYTFSNEYRI